MPPPMEKGMMMCDFFSFVTETEYHGGQRFYYNWQQRVEREHGDCDSHSIICRENGLDEDKCNKYEYNFITGEFKVDQINSDVDDRVQVEEWVRALDHKNIIEPLIIKPFIHPFEIEAGEVTEQDIEDLKAWASVRASVRYSVRDSVLDSVLDSVRDSVRDSVWASVWYSVRDSVRDSVRASVLASVWASVRAYISSFLDIEYEHDFTPAVRLWERGFVPSFDGTTWRLHACKDAKIVYEMKGK